MPRTAGPDEMPSWDHFPTLPKADQDPEDASRAVHPPPSAPPVPSLEEFASTSTLHGVNHIFCHGRYTVRNFLWTVAFVGSLAFLIHVCAERVGYYFQYPHATTLEEELLPSLTFPAVTICNINRLRFSKLTGHDLYWAGEFLGFLDSYERIAASKESADADVLELIGKKLNQSKSERNRPFDFKELHNRAGHQMNEMLVECKFGNKSCHADDFKTVSLHPLLSSA